jgi:hypothetical protein
MPATFHQRRGSLTMFFTAILRSVRLRGPTAIVAAEAAGLLRGK